ncbi:hypothetical protein Enr13x_63620 [Stieleria neptunia]|uniref:Uncharacterized protein n=1 Tax=Stieleria neptunia TaxID=2527979 RepID=A0A518I018_9BACT|nr:hypothetical protein Enr13x_63620 [Stieleria neptunia]
MESGSAESMVSRWPSGLGQRRRARPLTRRGSQNRQPARALLLRESTARGVKVDGIIRRAAGCRRANRRAADGCDPRFCGVAGEKPASSGRFRSGQMIWPLLQKPEMHQDTRPRSATFRKLSATTFSGSLGAWCGWRSVMSRPRSGSGTPFAARRASQKNCQLGAAVRPPNDSRSPVDSV